MLRGRYDLGTWAHPDSMHVPPNFFAAPLPAAHLLKAQRSHTRVDAENMRTLLSWRLSFWLNEIRFQSGLTQKELAANIETTQSAPSKWEHGRNLISLDTLGRLGACARIPIALYAELPSNQRKSAIWL